jgi:predicted kinase
VIEIQLPSSRLFENPTVVAIRGLPLSGKSTLARALGSRLRWHVIDVDDMRHVGAGKPNRDEVANSHEDMATKRREGEDMRIAYTLLHEAIRVNIDLGRSLIVAAAYSRKASQQFLLDAMKDHPCVRLKGICCSFDDTREEINRRLGAADRGRGGCRTVEHYLIDKHERFDYVDLWGALEINMSQPLDSCIAHAIEFIQG